MQNVLAIDVPSSVQLTTVFNPDLQPISCLVKKYENNTVDRTEAYNFLQDYVLGITAYFGATWSDFQIEEFSKDFFREFYFFNEADLRIFMNRIRTTEIKEFGNISPKILMNQLLQYREERLQEAERHSIQKKQKDETDIKTLSKNADQERDAMIARFNYIIEGKTDEVKKLKETIAKQSNYISHLTENDL